MSSPNLYGNGGLLLEQRKFTLEENTIRELLMGNSLFGHRVSEPFPEHSINNAFQYQKEPCLPAFNTQMLWKQTNSSTIILSPKSRKRPAKRLRPPYPYPFMITHLILESPSMKMTLNDIFDALQKKYPKHYTSNQDQVSWKNTVRYNLSRSGIFTQVPSDESDTSVSEKSVALGRKQSFWMIAPECMDRLNELQNLMTSGDARKSRHLFESWRRKNSVFEDHRMSVDWLLN